MAIKRLKRILIELADWFDDCILDHRVYWLCQRIGNSSWWGDPTLDSALNLLDALLTTHDLLVDLEIAKQRNGQWFAQFILEEGKDQQHVMYNAEAETPAKALMAAIDLWT